MKGAMLHGTDSAAYVPVTGEHDYRGGTRVGPESAKYLETIHPRPEVEIQETRVGKMLSYRGESLLSIA